MKQIVSILCVVVALLLAGAARAEAPPRENPPPQDATDLEVFLMASRMLEQAPIVRAETIEWFRARGKPDVIPLFLMLDRFYNAERVDMIRAIQEITGEDQFAWFHWMQWLEEHPDLEPVPGFDRLMSIFYAGIDPNFALFLYGGVPHDIALGEIAWGGVRKDGIPALNNPNMLSVEEADYLFDDDLVFGIEIDGDARAYPLRIMGWHEMMNDVIGGQPIALAYCTLCAAAIAFETDVPGFGQEIVFGTSGFLYRSNKLMYDRQTLTLWNQFTGEPAVGPLVGSGIVLDQRPVVTTSWGAWKARHPDTQVLDLRTGYERDYDPGRVYAQYFHSDQLMFPAGLHDDRLKPKAHVFTVRIAEGARAWPVEALGVDVVINDRIGDMPVVVLGNGPERTARAYRSEGIAFAEGEAAGTLRGDGATWEITEEALVAGDGRRLERLPGHIAYWFAWSNYMRGKDATLYGHDG